MRNPSVMNILQAHPPCKPLNLNILRPKYPGGGGGYPTPGASVSAAQTPPRSSANPPASPQLIRSPTAPDASQSTRAESPATQDRPHQTPQEQGIRYGTSSPTRTFRRRHTPKPTRPSSRRQN